MSTTNPPKGEVSRVGDLDIHYLSYGDGEPVVFLHGSGPGASAYSNFKQNVAPVVDAGCRAILVDLPGFGYSSKPTDCDYTTELFATAVSGLLKNIGLTRYTLVGNSLGGAICIRMALDLPDEVVRLVLMAPGGIEERETYFAMPGIAKMVSKFVDGGLDRNGLRGVLETLVFDASHVTDDLVEERFHVLETQPKEVLSRMIIPNMESELSSLACPIIGFWGQQDEMTPVSGAARFLDQCNDCQFTILSNCGHWVMVEFHEHFNRVLRDLLLQQAPA